MVSRKQKYMFGVAVILLGLAIKLPIWRIDIWSPQYPEGLSMRISASRIDGDVAQINILNHYIGMKHIVPDQIPELTELPWALAFVAAFGILVIILNRILWAKVWLASLGILGVGGFIDFYRWGYDYGHNLSPDAPIKIPGFSYQPPLFGYKKILNIEAYSLPDWGTYALSLGILLIFCGIYWEDISSYAEIFKKISVQKLKVMNRVGIVLLPFLSLVLMSCSIKPEPLKIGIDHCDSCHMQITDVRFGGEVITKKGRRYKFDSINCLQEYLTKNSDQISQIFVSDYFNPETLINVETAHFLSHSTLSGPMGSNTIASKDKAAIEKIMTKVSGKVTDWKGLSGSSL